MDIRRPVPVVLDTDIGNDIDDTWALGMLLKTRGLELKYLLSCSGDTEYRARVAAHYLLRAGYPGVPVGIGVAVPSQPVPESLHAGLGEFSLAAYPGPVYRDGISRLVELLAESREPVTVIGIGPMTNLAELCRRAPALVRKCRLVAMMGSIRRRHFGALGAVAEYNVKIDIPAAQTVLAAPWKEIVLTPLDHCGTIVLDGDRYRKLTQSTDPVVMEIIGGYRAWRTHFGKPDGETESSVLYDTAAVHLAASDSFTEFETLNLIVTDDGFTRIAESGRPVKVATGWSDREGYLDVLTSRFFNDTITKSEVSHETLLHAD